MWENNRSVGRYTRRESGNAQKLRQSMHSVSCVGQQGGEVDDEKLVTWEILQPVLQVSHVLALTWYQPSGLKILGKVGENNLFLLQQYIVCVFLAV